jgi:hypothetical protein
VASASTRRARTPDRSLRLMSAFLLSVVSLFIGLIPPLELASAGAHSGNTAAQAYKYDAPTLSSSAGTGSARTATTPSTSFSLGSPRAVERSAAAAGTIAVADRRLRAAEGELPQIAGGSGEVPDPEPQYKPNGRPNRGPGAWINVLDGEGKPQLFESGPEVGVHAEDNAQGAFPGNPMSRAFGWRGGGPSGPAWQEIPICGVCQGKYPPALFPPDVQAEPGGPWGQ